MDFLISSTCASSHATKGSTYGSAEASNCYSFRNTQRSGGLICSYRVEVLPSQTTTYTSKIISIIYSYGSIEGTKV